MFWPATNNDDDDDDDENLIFQNCWLYFLHLVTLWLGQQVPAKNTSEEPIHDEEEHGGMEHDESENDQGSESQQETTEEEPDFSSEYEPETETDTASEHEEDLDQSGNRCILFFHVLIILSSCYDSL